MHPADAKASGVLENLRQHFLLSPVTHTSIELKAAPGVLIGLEIEVPWRAYFPDLWRRFLKGERTFNELSAGEQAELASECEAIERTLLPRLNATVACGLKQGLDPYWEFAFPPANDLSITYETIRLLAGQDLLPWGPHSLHATISGVRRDASVLIALVLIELAFVREERLLQGFRGRGAWARKGEGGILVKKAVRLEYDAPYGMELRTLELPPTPEGCERLLAALAHLSHFLSGTAEGFARAAQRVRELLAAHQLPLGSWQAPLEASDAWSRYIERIPAMRPEARAIFIEELGFVP